MSANQPKRLYWFMVLLALLSTSTTTMGSGTIVTGSSASQHAFGVDQSNAQAKRNLTSNVQMTENIDGDNEDRLRPIDPSDVEKVKGFAKDLFTRDPGFLEMAKSKEETHPNNRLEAEKSKIEKLLSIYTEFKVRSFIAAGKIDPDTRVLAENLEHGLILKWLKESRVEDMILLGSNTEASEFLKSPLLTALINDANYSNEELYKIVYNMLASHHGVGALAKILLEAKANDATKDLGTELENLMLNAWSERKLSGDHVFELLGLNNLGATQTKSSLWKTWVLYMFELGKQQDSAPRSIAFKVWATLTGKGFLASDFDERELAELLLEAKANDATKDLGTELEELLLNSWSRRKLSGDDVFKLLELTNFGATQTKKSSLWKTWVLYMFELFEQQDPETQSGTVKLIIHKVWRKVSTKEQREYLQMVARPLRKKTNNVESLSNAVGKLMNVRGT